MSQRHLLEIQRMIHSDGEYAHFQHILPKQFDTLGTKSCLLVLMQSELKEYNY